MNARFTVAEKTSLSESNFRGNLSRPDKIAISREVVRLWDQSISLPLDLDRQIRRCTDFIRQANRVLAVARGASARRINTHRVKL